MSLVLFLRFCFFSSVCHDFNNQLLKHVEYDPNPLQSLGKRTKSKVNVEITDTNQPSTSTNVFSQFHSEDNDEHRMREQKEAYK